MKNKADLFRKASLGGTVIAAIGASLCCVGPLGAVLLGASGFVAAGFFAKWRPVLLATTFIFLAVAWVLTYRERKAACAEGSCATTPLSTWSKVALWIATALTLVTTGFPAFSSAVHRARRDATCCSITSRGSASTASLQLKIPAPETMNTNSVSFFRVPLVCPAAPQIGCGSASKPLLLNLERMEMVSEAWLNRAGTTVAIVWKGQSTAGQRTGAIEAVLKVSTTTWNELTGSAEQKAMKDFQSGSGWYRGTEVDRLSEEEAGIVAARLVQRVRAKTAVPPQKADGLQKAIADALKKRFTDEKVKQEQNALLKSGDGLRLAVREYLDAEQIPILKEALASGLRPLPDEK